MKMSTPLTGEARMPRKGLNIRHKYHARTTAVDGLRFDSKLESRRYEDLKYLQQAGDIVFFLRQAPFDLPGGVKYRADFVIFWADGTVTIEDVKGFDTPQSKQKRKQVEALYPITIDVIRKAG